jgi:hypothetical protein
MLCLQLAMHIVYLAVGVFAAGWIGKIYIFTIMSFVVFLLSAHE